MRSDMSKVIVERPRIGGKNVRKGRDRDNEDHPSKEGMRKPYLKGYNYKELNENLAPLYRFLHSKLGQRWDDVYSEICENIRVTSTVQEHIRVHIKQMVSTKIWIDDDGEPWEMDGRLGPLSNTPYVKYWVDPRDGLLKLNNAKTYKQRNHEDWQKKREEQAAQTRSLPGGIELRKAKGIWYQVELAPVPPIQKIECRKLDGSVYYRDTGGSAYDVILEKTVYSSWRIGSPYSATYCVKKRQLSHVEMKRYGVTND